MKFKVISRGITIDSTPGTEKGWGIFCPTEEEAFKQGRAFLSSLPDEQQKEAYVLIYEVKETILAEIHTAAEKGPNGELLFAIARS